MSETTNSTEDLSNIKTMYKREPDKRIFVNRALHLERIKFFGFDMDYTLAVYKSPQMEILAFDRITCRLVSLGYPDDFRSFKYDPVFPVRGLWLDKIYGNLLKVDGFGNILVALHGFHFMSSNEIESIYPNKFIHLTEQRVYVLNTLFNLPETYLVACVVDYFDSNLNFKSTSDKTGVCCGDVLMSYKSIFHDIRNAFDWAHFDSDMKKAILSNLDHYVEKDERLAVLLSQIKGSGRKAFLLTNSEYYYTDGIMSFLLGQNWSSYFDITVVDAQKPLWFEEGTVFREVNIKTGALKIGIHTGPLNKGAVYSGGSCDAFRQLVKARGKDVLYIGDHIFGDVLRSKKARGWRTFLVIPELNHQLAVWTGKRDLFEDLQKLDSSMADLCKNLDANTKDKPEISSILKRIKFVTNEMEQEYSVLGSLFRSGSRTTFFASQAERYADIYASNCCNLINYPMFYFFRAPMTLMPHESTVSHETIPKSMEKTIRQNSVGNQVREWITQRRTSRSGTIYHEEEDDEDLSARSSSRQEKFPENLSDDCLQNYIPTTNTDIVVSNTNYVDSNPVRNS